MNFSLPTMNYDVLAIINALVCSALAGICVCRLGRMHRNVLLRVKIQYVSLLVVSLASGYSPIFFRVWPSFLFVLFAAVVLYVVWSDNFQWKSGTPKVIETIPAPLEH
jgi:hypothetical protein